MLLGDDELLRIAKMPRIRNDENAFHIFTTSSRGPFIILLVGILMLACNSSFSQNYFLFNKKSYRQVIYKEGDQIAFRIKGSREKVSGKITSINDSVLVLGSSLFVRPASISEIYVDKKFRDWFVIRYKYAVVLPMIGAGYILADAINTKEFDPQTLKIGSAFIIAGVLFKILMPRTIKIRGKHKVAIIRCDKR